MTIRCKFRLQTVTRKLGSRSQHDETGKYIGSAECEMYDASFTPVYSQDPLSENKRFWDATPGGSFIVTTIKEMPWELGKEYYLDITPA